MDPELWHEPEKFDPTRFLSPEGRVVKPDFFIPFGTGRRMCLGDVLARHQIFLFFTSLIHVFDVQPVKGATLPDLVGKSAVTIIPDEYELCVTPRKPELLLQLSRSHGEKSHLQKPSGRSHYSSKNSDKWNVDLCCQHAWSHNQSKNQYFTRDWLFVGESNWYNY